MEKIKKLQNLSNYIFNDKNMKKFSNKEIPLLWTKVFFKEYPRLESITLYEPQIESIFDEILLKRKSSRTFSNMKLNFQKFSNLIYFSAGINNLTKIENWDQSRRMYPSAGARYPLEIYYLSLNTEGLKNGLYHYNPKNHSLSFLYNKDLKKEVLEIVNQEFILNSAGLFFISSIFERTSIKYGLRAYRFIYLDAGHLCQNIYLKSEDLGLGCCSIGGFDDLKCSKLLDLPENEFVLYICAIGEKNEK